ncbi:mitochondrial ribosomal protein L31 [Tilletiopsis washingtonensis]|uniref:Large ribosomal subunit protein mL60 n=1 Tax=Tilletiopsis washingtonensis TaxID=58919 RepID=A0A316ZFB4_9BASI|nr:mitochondrial ribosomal protein L31 [Tilletiopsis washingtonensis]PWN99708.1 mitochondrial ribosomal protein L31 [Tilletiopsis washingtonensis]
MFGAFRASQPSLGGLLWKVPYRLSTPRKARVRSRLQAVDEVIAAVQRSGVECAALDRALLLPTEQEMAPRDKYTTFSRTARDYRKGVHKVPKWTRLTLRENPRGF